MTRIAILDERLPAQIKENPAEFSGIDVVWAGTDVAELERKAQMLRPSVLIVNLDQLPLGDYADTHRRLLDRTRADLILTLYTFARRGELEQLNRQRTRTIKSPISLRQLRLQMMSVLVKDLFQGGVESAEPNSVSGGPARVGQAGFSGPHFTDTQLARLIELESAVGCECPNHVSELVLSLKTFEHYSRQCRNKNDADKAIHQMLHEETAKARQLMEAALVRLLEHEQIQL